MEKHHQKEYRKMRSVALWLQDNVCYRCNEKCLNPEVHHLNHNPLDNALNNLILLCRSCHKLYHRIPVQPPVPKKRITTWLLRKIAWVGKSLNDVV